MPKQEEYCSKARHIKKSNHYKHWTTRFWG